MKHQWAAALAAVALITTAAPAKAHALSNCTTGMKVRITHAHDEEAYRRGGSTVYWVVFSVGGVQFDAVIDTGFSGFLSIPRATLAMLRARGVSDIRRGPDVPAVLADGSPITQTTVTVPHVGLLGCDYWYVLPAVVTDGDIPALIGASFLAQYVLVTIDTLNSRMVLTAATN